MHLILFKFRKCIYIQTAWKANELLAQGNACGLYDEMENSLWKGKRRTKQEQNQTYLNYALQGGIRPERPKEQT